MNHAWKDASLPYEQRAEILVSQMTLEEKVSQMAYNSSALSRFGIPEYNWWNECLHGVARAGTATMFPQPIGMAAAFDAPQLHAVAVIISEEARIKHHVAARQEDRGIYKGLTMWTPNINLFRDPRWGRGHETYGEDPYLTSRLGVAFIRGLQGEDPRHLRCIATAKHYAVHSGPEALRHTFDAVVSKKDMAETYLPAFRAAWLDGKVGSFMGAYNRVNGEAACASPTLLGDILRGQWGFDGYVVSDCGAIEDIYQHHKLVDTPAEAAALAVRHGCDLCCGFLFPHLAEAVKQGLVDEAAITRAVTRLLLARFRLGLFDPEADQPYANLPHEKLDCHTHHAASRKMAQDSLVLLKNDGILPLNRDKLKTVAIIGPNADNRAALIGNYAGTPSETYTVLEGLRQAAPGIRFLLAEGCALTGSSPESYWGDTDAFRLAEAVDAAQRADLAIVVTGLTGEKEGEEGYGSGDRETMALPQSQRMLLDALAQTQTPKVLVNMTGSPTIFPHADRFAAILQAWYPGQMGGLAIADVLFGMSATAAACRSPFYGTWNRFGRLETIAWRAAPTGSWRARPPIPLVTAYPTRALPMRAFPPQCGTGAWTWASPSATSGNGMAGRWPRSTSTGSIPPGEPRCASSQPLRPCSSGPGKRGPLPCASRRSNWPSTMKTGCPIRIRAWWRSLSAAGSRTAGRWN